MEEILREGLRKMGLVFEEEAISQFRLYYELLVDWNQKMNLTAITEEREVVEKHFLDSVSPLTLDIIPNGASFIDVGTGAGFPGIPLKIMRKDLKVTLLDSLKKRTVFLHEVTEKLSLTDVEIFHGRAEDFGQKVEFREKFDFAFARAVSEVNVLLELALPFVKVGGMMVAFKGPNVFHEMEMAKNAMGILGGECRKIEPIQIPGTNMEHYLTIIQKIKHTPTAYPRKPGKPEKSPIK